MVRLHSTPCAARQRRENSPNGRSSRLRFRELNQQEIDILLSLLRRVYVSGQHSACAGSESVPDNLPCSPTRQSPDKLSARLPFLQPLQRVARVSLGQEPLAMKPEGPLLKPGWRQFARQSAVSRIPQPIGVAGCFLCVFERRYLPILNQPLLGGERAVLKPEA